MPNSDQYAWQVEGTLDTMGNRYPWIHQIRSFARRRTHTAVQQTDAKENLLCRIMGNCDERTLMVATGDTRRDTIELAQLLTKNPYVLAPSDVTPLFSDEDRWVFHGRNMRGYFPKLVASSSVAWNHQHSRFAIDALQHPEGFVILDPSRKKQLTIGPTMFTVIGNTYTHRRAEQPQH